MADTTPWLTEPSLPFKAHSSLISHFLVPYPKFIDHHLKPAATSANLVAPRSAIYPRFIATGAVVFDSPADPPSSSSTTTTPTPPPRVLLLQRALTDSMPGRWEIPGGAVDAEDATMLEACARELREEAGLNAVAIGPVVPARWAAKEGTERPALGAQAFVTGSGNLVFKYTFVVEVAREEEASGGGVKEQVVLDPEEHRAFVWATEQEVENCRMEDGTELGFTTRDQWWLVQDSFKLRRGEL